MTGKRGAGGPLAPDLRAAIVPPWLTPSAPNKFTPTSARTSTTRSARPTSPRPASASATTAGPRGSASTASPTPSGSAISAASSRCPGSLPEPLALRYHGHQFRTYNPDLGDGRGFLFAQARDLADGRLLDLGTKGSGQTPWSRGADGRLTLKGGVREILATEMLEALGVYTSKTFRLIETGEALDRGDEPSPTRSSVLVRLSHSHIRIGSLPAPRRSRRDGRAPSPRRPCDRPLLARRRCRRPTRSPRFYDRVTGAVARLGAEWFAAGFVHGVLNTDNINITGESFDYGPWRFLDRFDPGFTAAYFDQTGLYAFARQPEALNWNLARLGECLIPLSSRAAIEAVFDELRRPLPRRPHPPDLRPPRPHPRRPTSSPAR